MSIALLIKNILKVSKYELLKGTVAQDFLPLVFSTNRPHLVPEFTP
jgi:hypothetical protein